MVEIRDRRHPERVAHGRVPPKGSEPSARTEEDRNGVGGAVRQDQILEAVDVYVAEGQYAGSSRKLSRGIEGPVTAPSHEVDVRIQVADEEIRVPVMVHVFDCQRRGIRTRGNVVERFETPVPTVDPDPDSVFGDATRGKVGEPVPVDISDRYGGTIDTHGVVRRWQERAISSPQEHRDVPWMVDRGSDIENLISVEISHAHRTCSSLYRQPGSSQKGSVSLAQEQRQAFSAIEVRITHQNVEPAVAIEISNGGAGWVLTCVERHEARRK